MYKEYKSDFEFKDKRKYVHSSTLLEEFIDLIYSKLCIIEKRRNSPKIKAMFYREINKNGVFRLSEETANLAVDNEASASFTLSDSEKPINAVFIEDENENISRRVRTDCKIGKILLHDKFGGTCIIGCETQKAFIENVIEANKRIHLKSLNDHKMEMKVVNMYMKKFPACLPIDGSLDRNEVELQIKNVSYRNQENSFLTLNSLSFPGGKINSFEVAFITHII
ncbi:MAG: hypothetical protein OCC45_03425 [Desulfotalea sp.]